MQGGAERDISWWRDPLTPVWSPRSCCHESSPGSKIAARDVHSTFTHISHTPTLPHSHTPTWHPNSKCLNFVCFFKSNGNLNHKISERTENPRGKELDFVFWLFQTDGDFNKKCFIFIYITKQSSHLKEGTSITSRFMTLLANGQPRHRYTDTKGMGPS